MAETIAFMTGHGTTSHGFLLLHGWQNRRPEGHWQHWLADRLTSLGQFVSYPQLPDTDNPDLERWLEASARHLDGLPGGAAIQPALRVAGSAGAAVPTRVRARATRGERVVICHSLACLLWLHAVARHSAQIRVDRVLLVAPPSPSVVASSPEIAGFVAPPVTAAQLATVAAGDTRLVASDNDPYCPEGAADLYGRPQTVVTDIIAGGGHLDPDAGYGDWPSVLRWCLAPNTTITGRQEMKEQAGHRPAWDRRLLPNPRSWPAVTACNDRSTRRRQRWRGDMATKAWNVAIDGKEYYVELDHGTFSGKREVSIDHEVVLQEGMHLVDFGDQLELSIGGQPAVLEISTAGVDFDYALKVNNKVVPSIS